MTTLSLADTLSAFEGGVAGRVVGRDVVVAQGPDAIGYLQGQCSQDLSGLAVGEGRWSLLLTPQGKLLALVRVSASGPERFVVDVDAGFGGIVLERLQRFKLRVKATLQGASWQMAELRGPAAARHSAGAGGTVEVAPVVAGRFGAGVDLLGWAATLPPGVPAGDPAAFELARIEAGLPSMAAELAREPVPQETGLVPETVSFTKGCYTGQELVARIDARDNRVPRRLMRIEVPASAAVRSGEEPGAGLALAPREATSAAAAAPSEVTTGSSLWSGEREVGTLTSVAWSPRRQAFVALGYLRREVVPPAEVELRPAGGGAPLAARVVAPAGEGA